MNFTDFKSEELIGKKVLIKNRLGNRVGVIVRITKTQIILDCGTKYSKDYGFIIGMKSSEYSCIEIIES